MRDGGYRHNATKQLASVLLTPSNQALARIHPLSIHTEAPKPPLSGSTGGRAEVWQKQVPAGTRSQTLPPAEKGYGSIEGDTIVSK